MADQKKTINKGFLVFEKKKVRCPTKYDFNKGTDIFLCENFISIPELKFEGKISWEGCLHDFFLKRSSSKSLNKTGHKVYVHIRGRSYNKTLLVAGDSRFDYDHIGYFDVGIYGYEGIERTQLEFILLDEFKRDFSLNPIYNTTVNISEQSTQMLQSDLGKLLRNPAKSDVILQCKDGGLLKAHQIILTSRSVFFERMFSNNYLESTTNVVTCAFKKDVMKMVLEYIYSGTIYKSKVYELFEAADYFDINGFQTACENVIIKELTLRNVISTLRFAESLNAAELKQKTLIWINWKAKLVKESKEYVQLVTSASNNVECGQLLEIVNGALETPFEVFDES